MVSGSEGHPSRPAGTGTGSDWGFRVFVSWELWFLYLNPVCSPELPRGSRGRQGHSVSRDAEAQLCQWKWMNIHKVTFRFVPRCWCSSGGSCQHSRWEALKGSCATGKLLSFAGPVHVCGCVRGEVGQTSIYLIIFKRERETHCSLRLQKLLA